MACRADDHTRSRSPAALRAMGLVLAVLMIAACAPSTPQATDDGGLDTAGTPIALRHARYLTLFQHEGFVVARVRAPVADQGGAREEQSDTLVLVPDGLEPPPLVGALRGATIIRTPVRTIAANNGVDEAFLTALGVADRLVAVGGLTSFDDATRRRAKQPSVRPCWRCR